jgi:hypothetical protein
MMKRSIWRWMRQQSRSNATIRFSFQLVQVASEDQAVSTRYVMMIAFLCCMFITILFHDDSIILRDVHSILV